MADRIIAKSKWFAIAQATEQDEIITTGSDDVRIVARDDESRIILIEEPAFAFATKTLLLPGGVVETGEDVLVAAQRELQEEAGVKADTLDLIGAVRPWARYLRVTSHVVLAQGLRRAPLKGDEAHEIAVHKHPQAEVARMIKTGAITDAGTIAALALCLAQWR